MTSLSFQVDAYFTHMDCDTDIGLCSMFTVWMECGEVELGIGSLSWDSLLRFPRPRTGTVERKLLTKFTNQSDSTKATRAFWCLSSYNGSHLRTSESFFNGHPGMLDLMTSGDP